MAASSTDAISSVTLSLAFLPLAAPISDAKVLTGEAEAADRGRRPARRDPRRVRPAGHRLQLRQAGRRPPVSTPTPSKYRLTSIEEPLDVYNAEGHADLARDLVTPVASGEMLTSVAEHRELIRRRNELLSGHIDGERAERLANHPAFEGPEAEFMRARAARRRGDIGAARTLIMMCLERLPGSQQFAEFAEEVGADLPPRAREMRAERAAVQARLAQAYQGGPVSSD